MRDPCPACGHVFEREEGFFLGAFTISLGVTQLAVIAAIALSVVASLPDPSAPLVVISAVAAAVLTPIVSYPYSKTVWSAIDLIMHRPGRRRDRW